MCYLFFSVLKITKKEDVYMNSWSSQYIWNVKRWTNSNVSFEGPVVVIMKVMIWDMVPKCMIDKYQHFKGIFCFYLQDLKHWYLSTKSHGITFQMTKIFSCYITNKALLEETILSVTLVYVLVLHYNFIRFQTVS